MSHIILLFNHIRDNKTTSNFKCNHHGVKFDINKCHTHCFYTKIKRVFIYSVIWKFITFNANFFLCSIFDWHTDSIKQPIKFKQVIIGSGFVWLVIPIYLKSFCFYVSTKIIYDDGILGRSGCLPAIIYLTTPILVTFFAWEYSSG